ncbi:hypothetical protein, conserved [Plasmodium gonderi]|uniref:Uncharacterized protein n=1 Tax=Plasmodium gonderi TaxID=77519 RepID=A0A1Y1J9X0_PLAGO|nr:hypothetical protein, conserved [Plasmodium gonderi]GAW79286.1 hypothetical protein, conserved [Plasmodium gonderi]
MSSVKGEEENKKDEEIFKLRKLATIFKSECKKLKEENETLKKNVHINKKELTKDGGDNGESQVVEQHHNEYAKRTMIEKNYKRLKNFTLMLEEKITNMKNENKKRCQDLEEKVKGCENDLSMFECENEKLKKTVKEKEETVDKLKNKMEEFRTYLKEQKGMTSMTENMINQTIEYKLEIKKLRENLDFLKNSEEITSKERQQYRSMIMLCSQYKEKCKQLPILESKIEMLENKIKELEIFKYRDKEKFENIVELKNTILNHQIENSKLNEQLNEWTKFSKLYIDSKAIDIESMKKAMNEIRGKYNQVNSTKTDLEVKYKKLIVDMEIVKQNMEDKNLEIKIIKNRNRQLEKMYEFVKRDHLRELAKDKEAAPRGDSTSSTDGEKQAVETNTGDGIMKDKTNMQHGETPQGQTNTQKEEDEEKKKNQKLMKILTEYKTMYDFVKTDNEQKERLIEELSEKIKKYQIEFQKSYLRQKNAETISNELQLHEKEIQILKEEIENYKNKVVKLENDLIHVNNQWNDDNEKNETIINELKESIKKAQFDSKINNSTVLTTKPANLTKQEITTTDLKKQKNNMINILYTDLENLNSVDEIEFATLRNENLYLKSKIEVLKLFYSNQIKTYREAFLYILGWDIQIEQTDDDIFFILTSLFSTHDGKFVFIKTNESKDNKRFYNSHPDEEVQSKRVKLQEDSQTGLVEAQVCTCSTSEVVEKNHAEAVVEPNVSLPQEGSSNSSNNIISNNISSNNNNSSNNNDNNKCEKMKGNPYEGMIGERNEINTQAIMEKSNLENTNIKFSSIVKGCKYSLLLHGYYGIKWNQNENWKNHINKINTYPILLSLSCIEEFNNIKSQYSNSLGKNAKGMLFKL